MVPTTGVRANEPQPTAPVLASNPPTYPPDRREFPYFVMQLAVRVTAPFYFRFRARGLEHVPKRGPALVVVNHQSFLDPVFIGIAMTRPVRFLSRDTLFRNRFVTWILKALCAIPMSREAASTATIRLAISNLQQGLVVGIFPEGTRSTDGQIGPLKPGLIALVRRAEVPIIPVGIAGSGAALPRDAWIPRPKKCRVVFGPPIPRETFANLKGHGSEQALLDVIRDAMTQTYEEAKAWQSR